MNFVDSADVIRSRMKDLKQRLERRNATREDWEMCDVFESLADQTAENIELLQQCFAHLEDTIEERELI